MSDWNDVVREVTNDFCETFATDERCTGVMARFVAMGHLPEGVDPDDERVVAVVKRCRRAAGYVLEEG